MLNNLSSKIKDNFIDKNSSKYKDSINQAIKESIKNTNNYMSFSKTCSFQQHFEKFCKSFYNSYYSKQNAPYNAQNKHLKLAFINSAVTHKDYSVLLELLIELEKKDNNSNKSLNAIINKKDIVEVFKKGQNSSWCLGLLENFPKYLDDEIEDIILKNGTQFDALQLAFGNNDYTHNSVALYNSNFEKIQQHIIKLRDPFGIIDLMEHRSADFKKLFDALDKYSFYGYLIDNMAKSYSKIPVDFDSIAILTEYMPHTTKKQLFEILNKYDILINKFKGNYTSLINDDIFNDYINKLELSILQQTKNYFSKLLTKQDLNHNNIREQILEFNKIIYSISNLSNFKNNIFDFINLDELVDYSLKSNNIKLCYPCLKLLAQNKLNIENYILNDAQDKIIKALINKYCYDNLTEVLVKQQSANKLLSASVFERNQNDMLNLIVRFNRLNNITELCKAGYLSITNVDPNKCYCEEEEKDKNNFENLKKEQIRQMN